MGGGGRTDFLPLLVEDQHLALFGGNWGTTALHTDLLHTAIMHLHVAEYIPSQILSVALVENDEIIRDGNALELRQTCRIISRYNGEEFVPEVS